MSTENSPSVENGLDGKVRHILSLSGGKDSAALAIYMRDRVPDMEYIFHDRTKSFQKPMNTLLG